MKNEQEPMFEDYGLSLNSYQKYKNEKVEIELDFDTKKEIIVHSLHKKISDFEKTFNYKFFNFLLIPAILVGMTSFFGIIFSLFSAIENQEWNVFIIFSIIFIFVLVLNTYYQKNEDKISKLKNESEKQIESIEHIKKDKIENIKEKVLPFEIKSFEYYKTYLESFFLNNLHNKRSGTEEFERSLSRFSQMINEVDEIISKMMFYGKERQYNPLYEATNKYKKYLEGRQINHNYQKNKEFSTFNSVVSVENKQFKTINNNQGIKETGQIETTNVSKRHTEDIFKKIETPIINSISNAIEISNTLEENVANPPQIKEINNKNNGFWTNLMNNVWSEIEEANNNSTKEIINTIDIVSPEKKYSSPRKIDWENINKNKAITGLKGEEITVEMEKEYLKSINREDLAEKVKQVSLDGDGFGYDILSYFPDGQEKYIEVKSSKNLNSNSFNISSNELDFMKKNQYNYQVWRMFNVNENGNIPTLKIHNANDILTFKRITPVQYIVRME